MPNVSLILHHWYFRKFQVLKREAGGGGEEWGGKKNEETDADSSCENSDIQVKNLLVLCCETKQMYSHYNDLKHPGNYFSSWPTRVVSTTS